jgi:hypothetical protein
MGDLSMPLSVISAARHGIGDADPIASSPRDFTGRRAEPGVETRWEEGGGLTVPFDALAAGLAQEIGSLVLAHGDGDGGTEEAKPERVPGGGLGAREWALGFCVGVAIYDAGQAVVSPHPCHLRWAI